MYRVSKVAQDRNNNVWNRKIFITIIRKVALSDSTKSTEGGKFLFTNLTL